MKNTNNIISMDEYKNIESKIDHYISEKEFEEIHKNLVGKSSKSDYYEIDDCGDEFVRKLLSRDWGRSIAYQYSDGAKKFIKSKYISDYFKLGFKKLFTSDNSSIEIKNIINSDKDINNMSEEEIGNLYSFIKTYYSRDTDNEKKSSVASCFMSFLYKLDGKGITSYIKNNVHRMDFANYILLTSGLSDRASYYSGRGVNYGDLNDKHLAEIFRKLIKYDVDYGTEYVKLVSQMETLGATEFINSFKNFARNNFKNEDEIKESSNVSLDGIYGQEREVVGFAAMLSVMGRGNDKAYQISESEFMKNRFMFNIKPILNELNNKKDKIQKDIEPKQKRKTYPN